MDFDMLNGSGDNIDKQSESISHVESNKSLLEKAREADGGNEKYEEAKEEDQKTDDNISYRIDGDEDDDQIVDLQDL